MGFDSVDNKNLIDGSVDVTAQQTVAPTPVAAVPTLACPPPELYANQPLMYVYAPQGTFPVDGNTGVCAIPCGQLVYPQLGDDEVERRRHYERMHDREERRFDRKDGRVETREDRQEDREDRREGRGCRREERRDGREDARIDRREDREDRRDDREDARIDRREDRGDRREHRRDRRHFGGYDDDEYEEERYGRWDDRWARREGRMDARWERRDGRDDRREARGCDRMERREDRRDARLERREDRGEARWDRREGRVEARWDRRDARDERREGRGERRSIRRHRLAKASLITYIIGMLSFFPYPASAAIAIHMVRKRHFEHKAGLILAFAIVELIAWMLAAAFAGYGVVSGVHCHVRVALITWFLFGLSFGIPRMVLIMRHRRSHSYDPLESCEDF